VPIRSNTLSLHNIWFIVAEGNILSSSYYLRKHSSFWRHPLLLRWNYTRQKINWTEKYCDSLAILTDLGGHHKPPVWPNNNHSTVLQERDWSFFEHQIVLLPGRSNFKRAEISRLLKEEGREQFWPKKGNLLRTRKNLKNWQNFTTFRVNKMFSHRF
jgi:hypothetical protein